MQQFLIKALECDGRRIKCALGDHFVVRMPVSVAFFYNEKIASELIINSLSQVLKDFPIFAGILVKDDDGHLYIDCNNQGVRVTIVQSTKSLHDEVHDLPSLAPEVLVDMISSTRAIKEKSPLLTIKLSYYSDGMVMGCCWHHSVGDMSSFMEFLKAVSATTKGAKYSPPVIVEDRENDLQRWTQGLNLKRKESRLKCINFMDLLGLIKQIYSFKQGIFLYFSSEEIENLRSALSKSSGRNISKNNALCAYLLDLLAQCRTDNENMHHASIAVNYRNRLNMPPNILGNYIDLIPIRISQPKNIESIANEVHATIENYSFDPTAAEEFIKQNGGIKKIPQMILKDLLPQFKNLISTNWSNFDVYSIDFGITKPFLFLPLGRSPLPWVSCILKGFNNRGYIVGFVLPSKVAKKLIKKDNLHQYRNGLTQEETNTLSANPWCY